MMELASSWSARWTKSSSAEQSDGWIAKGSMVASGGVAATCRAQGDNTTGQEEISSW
jgi:hypothetical protein